MWNKASILCLLFIFSGCSLAGKPGNEVHDDVTTNRLKDFQQFKVLAATEDKVAEKQTKPQQDSETPAKKEIPISIETAPQEKKEEPSPLPETHTVQSSEPSLQIEKPQSVNMLKKESSKIDVQKTASVKDTLQTSSTPTSQSKSPAKQTSSKPKLLTANSNAQTSSPVPSNNTHFWQYTRSIENSDDGFFKNDLVSFNQFNHQECANGDTEMFFPVYIAPLKFESSVIDTAFKAFASRNPIAQKKRNYSMYVYVCMDKNDPSSIRSAICTTADEPRRCFESTSKEKPVWNPGFKVTLKQASQNQFMIDLQVKKYPSDLSPDEMRNDKNAKNKKTLLNLSGQLFVANKKDEDQKPLTFDGTLASECLNPGMQQFLQPRKGIHNEIEFMKLREEIRKSGWIEF